MRKCVYCPKNLKLVDQNIGWVSFRVKSFLGELSDILKFVDAVERKSCKIQKQYSKSNKVLCISYNFVAISKNFARAWPHHYRINTYFTPLYHFWHKQAVFWTIKFDSILIWLVTRNRTFTHYYTNLCKLWPLQHNNSHNHKIKWHWWKLCYILIILAIITH